jgi:hypothetical protein
MRHLTALAASMLISLPILAQNFGFDVKHLDKLAKHASEYVVVNISGTTIRLASRFLKDEPEVYNVMKNIKGIYVRALVFEKDNAYSDEDVEAIKRQIKMPPWEPMVQVIDNKNGENVNVYISTDPKKDVIKGLLVLVAERRELALINIVGDIDLDKLDMLGGNMGIPKKDYKKMGKEKRQNSGLEKPDSIEFEFNMPQLEIKVPQLDWGAIIQKHHNKFGQVQNLEKWTIIVNGQLTFSDN